MTIEQFIDDRIAEDSAEARQTVELRREPFEWRGNRYLNMGVISAGPLTTLVLYQFEPARTVELRWDDDDYAEVFELLREVTPEAKKQLATFTAVSAILADHDNDEGYCSRCWDGDWYAPASRPYPCPTVRSVAAIWSDHPDYRREWKP